MGFESPKGVERRVGMERKTVCWEYKKRGEGREKRKM
jgi:hypothetical protein